MTDLELREEVHEDWAHQFPDIHRCFVNGVKVPKEVYDALDAHLKEDAERHEAAMLFAQQRDEARAELTRLRQLIEEK